MSRSGPAILHLLTDVFSNYSENIISYRNCMFKIPGGSFVSYDEVVGKAKPGDLIEFYRGNYNHWAMYAGDGNVYNICAEDKHKTQALIKLQSLKYVCELDSNPAHQKVRINNLEAEAFSRFMLKPLDKEKPLNAAKAMVNQYQPYSFIGTNCEYYCTLWKYGKGFSAQVDTPMDQIESLLGLGRPPVLSNSSLSPLSLFRR